MKKFLDMEQGDKEVGIVGSDIERIVYKKSHRNIPGFWAGIYLCPERDHKNLLENIQTAIPSHWVDEAVFFPTQMMKRKEMEALWEKKYCFTQGEDASDAWKIFFQEVQAHLRQGRIDIAGAALMYIYKHNPYFLKKYKRYYIFEDIAYAYEAKGELYKSIKYLKAQTRLQPNSTEAYLNMSSFLILNGLSAEAIDVCKEGLKINATDVYLNNNLLIAYLNEGHIETAIDYLNQRIAQNPQTSMNWKLMGDIFCEIENFDGAVRCYQKALQVNSADLKEVKTDIYYSLGICYQHMGQIRKAIKYYKCLLAYNKADPMALLNLSKLYGEDLKQYHLAEKYAERLVHLYPENGYGHHNLGLIYFYTSRFDKAKWHLYRAKKLVPDYQPVYDAIKELKKITN